MSNFAYRTVVDTAAASKDMTVLATIKRDLGITNDASDEKLADLIRQASADIVRELARDLAEESVTDHFRGFRGPSIWLSRWPVSAISAAIECGTTLTGDDYELNEDTGELLRIDSDGYPIAWGWSTGTPRTVTVSYTGGYAMVTGLPEDLERACLNLVKVGWFALGRDSLVKSESVPGVLDTTYWVGAVGENGSMPPDVLDRVAPYRRVVV